MNFQAAMQTEDTTTENGMVTSSSSLSACLNLFFQIGAMRARPVMDKVNLWASAFAENPLVALRLLFYTRDVRGGQGERQTFRDILVYVAMVHPKVLSKNLHLIPEYGRWDDVLVLLNISDELNTRVTQLIASALISGNKLCGKWMPRKGPIAVQLTQLLGLTPKQYRKILVNNTEVVETLMCSGKWDEIKYGHVPSIAAKNYRKAFIKRDGERYSAYLESLVKGEEKVNAGAIFPHDIVKAYGFEDDIYGRTTPNVDVLLEEQWKALPNYYTATEERILPLCDVSGSMHGEPMCVSLSLGVYLSERNSGAFKDLVMTFSANPELFVLNQLSLKAKLSALAQSKWGTNTNLERAFEKILQQGIRHNVPQDEMPTMFLIISDMEFDEASKGGFTAQTMIEEQYANAGYKMPRLVYWNVRAKGSNFPVQVGKEGTALVSGFSPSIVKSLLSNPSEFTPEGIMNTTINSERYAPIAL
jgi:hypothetical protein